MEFLSYLISGISLGSVYAIIALGYTMVYGIAKMLNFAHGDIIMIGGYVSFCAMFYLGLPNIVAVLLAVIVCTVLGVVIERLAYKPLRSAPSLAVLITAIGVSYFLQNSALLIWKAAARVYPPVVEFFSWLFRSFPFLYHRYTDASRQQQQEHKFYRHGIACFYRGFLSASGIFNRCLCRISGKALRSVLFLFFCLIYPGSFILHSKYP